MLDILFALDRQFGGGVLLVVDELLDTVLFGEAFDQPFAMFGHTPDKIVRDADIKRPARPVCEDVDPEASHAGRQHGLPGQARQ